MVPQHFNIRAIFVHIACISALLTGVSALAQSTTTTPATTSTVAQNSEAGKWTVFVAPYTFHFSDATKESTSEPDGIKHSYVWLVGAEKMLDEKYFAGASFSAIHLDNPVSTFILVRNGVLLTQIPNYLPNYLAALFMAISHLTIKKSQSTQRVVGV